MEKELTQKQIIDRIKMLCIENKYAEALALTAHITVSHVKIRAKQLCLQHQQLWCIQEEGAA